ncbi:sodium/calcium exchanger Calx-like [Amphiura filiformis]|uniref:sodium/calcium exchanger Calx-like n=1 Tax=Amphiura filiformis TaxID=82378 RepID=UPI003B21D185
MSLILAETFRFENPEYTVGENCGVLRVNIIRSGLAGEGTTLRISTSDTGATFPQDFSPSDAIVTFRGEQEVESVTFDIVGDSAVEGSETFSLTLSKLSGSGTIEQPGNVAVVTIQDQIGTFSFESDQMDTTESIGTLRIPISRSIDSCATATTIRE